MYIEKVFDIFEMKSTVPRVFVKNTFKIIVRDW